MESQQQAVDAAAQQVTVDLVESAHKLVRLLLAVDLFPHGAARRGCRGSVLPHPAPCQLPNAPPSMRIAALHRPLAILGLHAACAARGAQGCSSQLTARLLR